RSGRKRKTGWRSAGRRQAGGRRASAPTGGGDAPRNFSCHASAEQARRSGFGERGAGSARERGHGGRGGRTAVGVSTTCGAAARAAFAACVDARGAIAGRNGE